MCNKSLIVVSFGSSVPEARDAISNVERIIGQAYPDRRLISSYTSGFIRRKLAREGLEIFSPEELLGKLAAEGCQDVVIVPTHIIPGKEYDGLVELAEGFQDRFESLKLRQPLVYTANDLVAVSGVLKDLYPLEEGEALLLMGHGTDHLANFIFPGLETALRYQGLDHAYVATIEGWPGQADAIGQMKKDGIERVYMAPFLFTAGAHVLEDMVGDQEDSWLSTLKREGFQVRYCDQGLNTFPEIIALYVRQ